MDESKGQAGGVLTPVAYVAADLHQQIMNLSYSPAVLTGMGEAYKDGYAMGHRDARHAAAELVAASPAAAAGVPTDKGTEVLRNIMLGEVERRIALIKRVAQAQELWEPGVGSISMTAEDLFDFARALLSAGSQGEQHNSSHEAAPQSSVASAAPLPSLSQTDESALPRGADAPTDLQIMNLAKESFGMYAYEATSLFIQFARAILSHDRAEMTDRERLELAAKAAGIDLRWLDDVKPGYFDDEASLWRDWNPLTDDGDALRLTVKLQLDLSFFPGFKEIKVEPASVYMTGHAEEPYAEDMNAATRRAIVRAAAEIGLGQLSVSAGTAGAEMARPDGQNTAPFPPPSVPLPREPL